MNATKSRSKTPLFAVLLVAVVFSNYLAYRLPAIPLPQDTRGMVIGSLVDLSIVAPLLILAMTRKKGFTLKRFVTFMVLGLVASRFIIPSTYFAPFAFIPYIAIGGEALFLLAELGLIFLLIKHIPSIFREMKLQQTSGLFAFPALVKQKVSGHPLVSMLAAESLMFYYAFASWKRKPELAENQFTLHQKTSLVAFYIMLIHAIAIETIGFHWWLHEKSVLLAIGLLVLNVYSIVYFLADIQAVRLNPVTVGEDRLYVSLGLGKRMEIPYQAIERIEWGTEAEAVSLKDKEVIDFIARDFEEGKAHCVIHFNVPLTATMLLGMEKPFRKAAIRLDEPITFRRLLEEKMA
ncbi:beta-carotene 15,15'-monooxygenase [Sporosarcina cyprini]|uniref:beta-carotene 15,15'-monooxygenase n=1 Tax=Sporosarcina cyprini TaxID=2910523 RepID=UPI001EDF0024|nr:beta-carotene 15,15'-monooxygenase [Sporosarcina cyprini]MCG3087036.1 beta-carotene 15,15'-monooxygenase [Sporosarcina cyprini]